LTAITEKEKLRDLDRNVGQCSDLVIFRDINGRQLSEATLLISKYNVLVFHGDTKKCYELGVAATDCISI
jgi:hypothetical protein